MKRSAILISSLLILFFLSDCRSPKAKVSKARPSAVCMDAKGAAIQGYDTVAFFTDHKAVKGTADFVFNWKGAVWYFSSAAHRDLFAASPEGYAPQYGGWCALSTSGGDWLAASPEAWVIQNNKLYFFVNGVPKFISKFVPHWTDKADENWAKAEEIGLKTDK